MEKVAIIGTVGVPSRYGGFETLVHNLVIQWKGKFDLYIYCSKKNYKPEEQISEWEGARLFYLPFNANGAQSIIYDIVSIFHALFYADTLLILGTSGCIIIPLVRLFTNKKVIVNIDGQEWKRQKWNTIIRRYLKFSEYLAVKFSHADIADNAAIKRYTALNYKTLSYQIEYGADHAAEVQIQPEDYITFPFLKSPYCFKVCRIEPENNVHIILEAFSKLPEKTLVIVGNWNNSEYGKQLKIQYQVFPHLHIIDPIYHQRTLDLLRSNCAIYIHGHSAGGTNPSLVEAMYLKLPVIAFNVSYNVATTANKALYFKNALDLEMILKKVSQEKLDLLRVDLKNIADQRYVWKLIADKYAQLIYAFEYKYKKKPVKEALSNIKGEVLQDLGLSHLKSSRKFFE
jgi:glycosyltransferase involved in cell wall biosynthesis